ncbi:hypothetical protein QUF74_01170 [Candidatus Halobeggiatoa sp. HSG11]|nr:hypothetical protein [Candidatus Halobeggiatoa sp. HSG11]
MVKGNNPAGRLLNILEELKDWYDNNRQSVTYGNHGVIWIDVLELEVKDGNQVTNEEIIEAVSCVYELMKDTKRMFKVFCSREDYEHYFTHFDKIETLVRPRDLNDDDFPTALANIDEHVLHTLKTISMLLSDYDEESLNKIELDEIKNSVEELFSEIHKSAINPDLRICLLESLEAIREIISKYKIYGAKDLKDNFQKIVGGIATNYESLESSPSLKSKLYDFLGKVAKPLNLINEILKLTSQL